MKQIIFTQKIYENINTDNTTNGNILDTIMLTSIKNNLLGIINIDNSCYINSIIQILLHCDIFLKHFQEKHNIIIKKPYSLIYLFYELLLNIYINIKKKKIYRCY